MEIECHTFIGVHNIIYKERKESVNACGLCASAESGLVGTWGCRLAESLWYPCRGVWGPGHNKSGDFLMYLVLGEIGGVEPQVSMLAWCASGSGVRNFEWAWILGVWKGKVPG